MSVRSARTSAARADEREGDEVDAELEGEIEVVEVLRVMDGMGSGTPGRLTPLCEGDDAADDDLAARAATLDRLYAQLHVPVVDEHLVPDLQDGAGTAG